MALKSTIFKAMLQVADIDHGYYADHALTLARHPSETDQRMMVRLVALALNAHRLDSECRGDGRVTFGKGLSDPSEPDVMLVDFTGRMRVWIEVGQPDERALLKAGAQADAVIVYAYGGGAADTWWRSVQGGLARLTKVQVWRLPVDEVRSLETLAERSMTLQATVQDGALTLSGARGSVMVEAQRWQP